MEISMISDMSNRFDSILLIHRQSFLKRQNIQV
jgi:hypothetical protein